MKKLMITLTAAALAFGLRAADEGFKAGTGFEDGVAPSAETTDWTLPEGDDNRVLTVTDYEGSGRLINVPAQYDGDETNAKYLDLRTTFGKPVELNVSDATMGGIYFDSLVKFTACDEDPVASTYENAKLIVYTKENEDGTQNLFVMAGKLDSEKQVTPTAYDCGEWNKGDQWVRLTIKTIGDAGAGVPAFVVFIDGREGSTPVMCDDVKTDVNAAIGGNLTNVGTYWNNLKALFPSLVQTGDAKGTVTSVGFDGQGKIDDLAFTATTPDFCADPGFFTLSWNDKVEVTSYTINDEAPVAVTSADGQVVIPFINAPVSIKVEVAAKPNCAIGEISASAGASYDAETGRFTIIAGASAPVAEIAGVDMTPKMQLIIDGADPVVCYSFADLLAKVNNPEVCQAGSKVTVKLTDDLSANADGEVSEATFTSAAEVTLDLAGHTITGTEDIHGQVVVAVGNFKITDSSELKTGKIVAVEGNTGAVGVFAAAEGDVTTIDAGTFDGLVYVDEGYAEEEVPAAALSITGGNFAGDSEAFYLADSVAEGYEAKYADGYWTVAAVEKTGWALYLAQGENENEFLIQDEEDLIEFATYMETSEDFATTGVTFKQTANIDLDGEIWDGPGESRTTTGAFMGVYDGNGKTISNLTLAKKEYNGFIGCMAGASQLKNLTILVKGFGREGAASFGGAGAVGFSMGTDVLVENVTVKGQTAETELDGTHNIAGIGCRLEGKITLRNCTNELNLASNYSKVGGMCAIASSRDAGGDIIFDGCVNKGNARVYGAKGGSTGLSGIIGYIENGHKIQGTTNDDPAFIKTLTIVNCENWGVLTADSTATAAKIGSIAAYLGGYTRGTISGNTAKADVLAVANGRSCDGLNFATVADGVATFVADSAVVAGGTYKVMADGKKAVEVTLKASETIAFDKALVSDFVATVNPDTGATVSSSTEGTVTTYTARALNVVTASVTFENATATVSVADEAEVVEGTKVTVTAAKAADGYKNVKVTINGEEATEFTVTDTTESLVIVVSAEKMNEVTASVTLTGATATVSVKNGATVREGTEVTVTGEAATEGYEAPITVTINGVARSTYTVTAEDTELIITVVATESAKEDWEHPATDITETTTAAQAWPSLAESPLATANAGKLKTWAETQKVDFADAASIKVDAFLLDCANTDEAVKAAKAEFKVTSLTQDAEGKWVAKVGTVGDGEAYKNGYVAIVEVTIEGADKANSKFYQATLNLQPAVK